jgi:hypothetical protein
LALVTDSGACMSEQCPKEQIFQGRRKVFRDKIHDIFFQGHIEIN